MALQNTQETYRRLMEDKDYTNKAISEFIASNYGSNTGYEIRGDNIIVGDGSVAKYTDIAKQAIDLQTTMNDRPELREIYRDRQRRVDNTNQATNDGFGMNLSSGEADARYKALRQAGVIERDTNNDKGLPSNRYKKRVSGLPSER